MTLRDIANNIPKKMGKTKAQIFRELCAACDGVHERTIRFWFGGQTEIPSKQLCDKLKRYLETYDISAGEEVFAEEIKALDELAGRRYRIEEPKEGHPRYHAEYPPHILLPEDIEKYEISFPTRELLDYYSAVAMSDGDRGAGAVLYCGSGKDQLENARKIH